MAAAAHGLATLLRLAGSVPGASAPLVTADTVRMAVDGARACLEGNMGEHILATAHAPHASARVPVWRASVFVHR
jgi:hypothetical protein